MLYNVYIMGKSTETTEKIIRFIKEYIGKNHISPSYQEIADAFNLKGKSTISYHINKLKSQGKLNNIGNIKRGLVINEEKKC